MTTPYATHIPWYLFHFHPLAGFCPSLMDRQMDLSRIIAWLLLSNQRGSFTLSQPNSCHIITLIINFYITLDFKLFCLTSHFYHIISGVVSNQLVCLSRFIIIWNDRSHLLALNSGTVFQMMLQLPHQGRVLLKTWITFIRGHYSVARLWFMLWS